MSEEIKTRINNIIAQSFTITIGDAYGIDKIVQHYLSSQNYSNVLVFCMEGGCRNNVGNWPTRIIQAVNARRKDFIYYSTKDRAMALEADYGLMIWDGYSRGTLTNLFNLLQKEIPVVLYVNESVYTLYKLEHLFAVNRASEESYTQYLKKYAY